MSKGKVEFKVELEGIDEAVKKLLDIADGARNVLEPAALAGAEVLRRAAASLAPGPGIIAKVTSRSDVRVHADIGPDQEHWYYQFSETGVAPHEITGVPLVFEGREGLVRAASVSHPGMPARPFLRTAVDQDGQSAANEAGSVFKREIDRYAS